MSVLPGMPEPPPVTDTTGLSRGQRLTERQAQDIREGRHPLGGSLHPQADQGARPGDSSLPYRCGSCIHRVLLRYHDRHFPKCERRDITHGAATDCRRWWPACPEWEDAP